MPGPNDSAAQLYLQRDMSAPEDVFVGPGQACVVSIRCPGKETCNEDAAAVIPASDAACVLVVADGLGGSAAGELAARLAVESLQTAVQEALSNGALLRTAIINGIENANAAIAALSMGAATTIAVVEVDGSTIRPYHVGDSMILLVGGGGKVKLQTVPHSPVGYAVESGLINEGEAMHHDDRHVVSNVVGSTDMHITIGAPIQLAARDTLVLATDGLFDNLYVDRIAETVRKGALLVAANNLLQMSHQRMRGEEIGAPSKPDDLTFVVYRQRPRSTPANKPD